LWALGTPVTPENSRPCKNTLLLKAQVENSGQSMAFAEAKSQGNLDVAFDFSSRR
jgi:hypothetical protein